MIVIKERTGEGHSPDDYTVVAVYNDDEFVADIHDYEQYLGGRPEEYILQTLDGPDTVAMTVDADVEEAVSWVGTTEKGYANHDTALDGEVETVTDRNNDTEPEEDEMDVTLLTDFSKASEWKPYQGPRGGEGWQHIGTGRVVYQNEPPAEGSDPEEVADGVDDPNAEPSDGYAEGWQEAPESVEQIPEGSRIEFYRDGSYYGGELFSHPDYTDEQISVDYGDGLLTVQSDEITAVSAPEGSEIEEPEQSLDLDLGPTDSLGSDWEDYDFGDEKWWDKGDYVAFEEDGDVIVGEFVQEGLSDGLFSVDTDTKEGKTITDSQVVGWRNDDGGDGKLDSLRQELKEQSDVGTHNEALRSFTNDNQYRRYQSQLREAEETARNSRFYDKHPQKEIQAAALATADKEMAENMKRIQSQASQSLGTEVTTYRGIDVDPEEFLDKAEEAMESGGGLRDEGFQSTSIDESVAENFGNVVLEVKTDRGVYLRGASEHASEDEVLLPAGTEFQVNDVDHENNRVKVTPVDWFDLSVSTDNIREMMQEQEITYAEAVENIV